MATHRGESTCSRCVWRCDEPAIRTPLCSSPLSKSQANGRKTQRTTGLTDTEELYPGFWSGFRDTIEEAGAPLSARKPFPENRYSNPIGRSGMRLQFKISVRKNFATAQFVIDDSPDAYETLFEDAESIENGVEGDLGWQPVEDSPDRSNRSQMAVTRDIDLANREAWAEYQHWLFERGTELHTAFSDRVRRLTR